MKTGRLELKENAILCPVCRRKIRGVRLQPGTVIKDLSIMCQGCRWVGIVNIDGADVKTYEPGTP